MRESLLNGKSRVIAMMKLLVKALIPIGVIAAFVGLLVNIPSANAERISCTGRRTVMCRINEPNVNRPVTEYPDVTFEPGDRVTINAGGCVQTGGRGRTWKRYVNPSSDNDLYHGLISIPGVTNGFVRIENVIGRTFTIPQNINPQNLYLRLGYEDDDYGDNGYWGHDDGTANQCRGVGSAWVTLRIQPSP